MINGCYDDCIGDRHGSICPVRGREHREVWTQFFLRELDRLSYVENSGMHIPNHEEVAAGRADRMIVEWDKRNWREVS